MSKPRPVLLGRFGVIAALLVAACQSEEINAPGGLMIALSADVQLPKDVSEVGIQVRDKAGVVLLERWYSVDVTATAVKLPATIALESANSDGVVRIRVLARKGERVLALRETETTVPRNRTALLRLPIEWLSFGMTKPAQPPKSEAVGAAGAHELTFAEVESSCPKDQTSIAGNCESLLVDSAALPAYSSGLVFGSGTGKGDGECFDTAKCFESVIPLIITNRKDCTALPTQTVSDPSHATVGLVAADGSGVCGTGGCIVPLDFIAPGAQGHGWSVDAKGIHLPSAVCRKLDEGSIRAVVGTILCKSKQLATPLCGPWSSVKSDVNAVENPGVLSDCKAFARAACTGIARCRGGVGLPEGVLNDDDSCFERMGFLCDASLALPEAVSFRPYFEACSAAFDAPCDQFDAEVRRACVEPEASVTPKSLGEACHFGECAAGLTCFNALPNGIGVCAARFGANQVAPCAVSGGLDVLMPQGACASGLFCDATTQTCLVPNGAGSPCSSEASCSAGLACSAGACATLKPKGAPCVVSGDCASKLSCFATASGTRCLESQDPGALCFAEPANAACSTARYLSDGATCDANSECLMPAQCLDAKCRLRPIFGANPLTMQPVPGALPCSAGLSMCAAGCKNLLEDAQNCGRCGIACPASAPCVAGHCEVVESFASGGTGGAISTARSGGAGGVSSWGSGGTSATGGSMLPIGGQSGGGQATAANRVSVAGQSASSQNPGGQCNGGAGGVGAGAGVAGFVGECPVTPPNGGSSSALPSYTLSTQGYLTTGAWHGYAWASADTVGSTTSEPVATATASGIGLCVNGNVVPGDPPHDYGWVDLGYNIHQSNDGNGTSLAPDGAGLYVEIDNRSSVGLRVEISDVHTLDVQGQDVTKRWCAPLSNGANFIPWSAFRTQCWNTSGVAYRREPLASVEVVMLPSPVASTPFDVCIMRLSEYGKATNELVDANGQVGGNRATTADDPMGIQGSFWAAGDGVKYVAPSAVPCSVAGCCINGATVVAPNAWGGVLGLDLKWYETGQLPGTPSACPYRGAADCFDVTFSGTTGGSNLEFKARSTPAAASDGETSPRSSIGAFTNGWTGRVCFSDLACPSWSPKCAITNDWYDLEFALIGGSVTGNFDFCLTSLRAVDNQGAP